jgi:hypothetical protein
LSQVFGDVKTPGRPPAVNTTATIDVSVDGGKPWTNAWASHGATVASVADPSKTATQTATMTASQVTTLNFALAAAGTSQAGASHTGTEDEPVTRRSISSHSLRRDLICPATERSLVKRDLWLQCRGM